MSRLGLFVATSYLGYVRLRPHIRFRRRVLAVFVLCEARLGHG